MRLECQNCGNNTKFKHIGNGWELRQYRAEDGTSEKTITSDITADRTVCWECESEDVEFVEH